MKFIMALIVCFQINSAKAIDFGKYIDQVKSEVNSLLGKDKDEEKTNKYKMPKIPRPVSDPKSVSVYDKNGQVYQAGESFRKLSQQEKNKFNYLFVKEMVIDVRGAEATESELNKFINVLEQGGSREGVYRSIVLSSDYKQLELYEDPASDKLIDYGYNFGVEFLGMKFQKESMKQLNPWSVKRVLVEKTLEVIDAFPKDGKNLYLWYGILSKKLADDFKIWKNKVRKSKNVETHLKWAKKVPLQHLKSEVIIKLNKVFNKLQED